LGGHHLYDGETTHQSNQKEVFRKDKREAYCDALYRGHLRSDGTGFGGRIEAEASRLHPRSGVTTSISSRGRQLRYAALVPRLLHYASALNVGENELYNDDVDPTRAINAGARWKMNSETRFAR